MTPTCKFSKHGLKRMEERNIKREWVETALNQPDEVRKISSDEWHFYKRIKDCGNKVLKVIFNPLSRTLVTAFFDRRYKGHENRL